MFGVTRSRFAFYSLAPFLLGIFGFSVVLCVIDAVVGLSGVDLLHQSSLRIALTYPRVPKDDSWRPMLLALQAAASPGGSHIYETLFFERSLKFQYPLSSLLYLLPFRDWPADEAMSLLNKLNICLQLIFAVVVAALADVAARRSRFLETQPGISRIEIIAVSFFAAMIFYPAAKAVDNGQIQVWLNLAFALSLLFWVSGQPGLAGALLGFASTIKPQFGLLLLWGLLWRDWRFVAGYLIAIVPVGAASLAIFGLHNNLEYFKVLTFISERGEVYYANNSVNGIVNRLLFNGNAEWFSGGFAQPNDVVLWSTRLAFVALMLFGLRSALFHKRDARPNAIDLGVATLCAVMSSPVAWEHHYGIAMPLFVIAFFCTYGRGYASRPIAVGLFLSWSLAANYTDLIALLSQTHFNLLQAHLFFACLWLAWFLGTQRGDEGAWLEHQDRVEDRLPVHTT